MKARSRYRGRLMRGTAVLMRILDFEFTQFQCQKNKGLITQMIKFSTRRVVSPQ